MATDQHRYPSLSRQPQGEYSDGTPAPSVPHYLALPYIQPQRNSSSSSLLDAVIGGAGSGAGSGHSSRAPPLPPSAFSLGPHAHTPAHSGEGERRGGGGGNSTAASSLSHGDSSSLVRISERGESDWDVLSDASGRVDEGGVSGGGRRAGGAGKGVNEGEEGGEGEEVVKDLQDKVAKRRSQLPRLESQLADLEAQIKAAEERLARVQGGEAGAATAGVGAATAGAAPVGGVEGGLGASAGGVGAGAGVWGQ